MNAQDYFKGSRLKAKTQNFDNSFRNTKSKIVRFDDLEKANTAPLNFKQDKTIIIPNQQDSQYNYQSKINNSNINLSVQRSQTPTFSNSKVPPLPSQSSSQKKKPRRKIFEEFRPANELLFDVLQNNS